MKALTARRFGQRFRAKKFTGGFSYAPIVDLRALGVFVKLYPLSLRCFSSESRSVAQCVKSIAKIESIVFEKARNV